MNSLFTRILFLLTIFQSSITAQDFSTGSDTYRIYKITPAEYKSLLNKYILRDDSVFGREPFAVIPHDSLDLYLRSDLPRGNFAITSLEENSINFLFRTKSELLIQIQHYHKKP